MALNLLNFTEQVSVGFNNNFLKALTNPIINNASGNGGSKEWYYQLPSTKNDNGEALH